MPACQYVQWDSSMRRLECCGEEATLVLVKNKRHYLCPAHKEFALDAVNDYEVKLFKLQEKQARERAREEKRKAK